MYVCTLVHIEIHVGKVFIAIGIVKNTVAAQNISNFFLLISMHNLTSNHFSLSEIYSIQPQLKQHKKNVMR